MALPPIFDEAIHRAFQTWTILHLAVEGGWGGRDSQAKRIQLKEEVVESLLVGSKKRRPPSHESPDDVHALATYLYTRLEELFNVESDDGSDEEVAHLCLRLFNTCRVGDLSFAQQFMEQAPAKPTNVDKCQGIDRVEYATEEEGLAAGLEGLGIRGDGDGSSSGSEDGGDAGRGVSSAKAPFSLVGSELTAVAEDDEPAAPEPAKPKREVVEPVVDEDGFTSVVKGGRRRGGR